MTKKIVWRLKETPTSENLRELVKDGILSKDEAREILFSEVQESERDIESFKQEIKFLREMVEKLSRSRTQIVEVIKEVKVPYYRYDWVQPYRVWCSNTDGGATNTTSGSGFGISSTYTSSFSSIKTF